MRGVLDKLSTFFSEDVMPLDLLTCMEAHAVVLEGDGCDWKSTRVPRGTRIHSL
jgi:hypothetical protein